MNKHFFMLVFFLFVNNVASVDTSSGTDSPQETTMTNIFTQKDWLGALYRMFNIYAPFNSEVSLLFNSQLQNQIFDEKSRPQLSNIKMDRVLFNEMIVAIQNIKEIAIGSKNDQYRKLGSKLAFLREQYTSMTASQRFVGMIVLNNLKQDSDTKYTILVQALHKGSRIMLKDLVSIESSCPKDPCATAQKTLCADDEKINFCRTRLDEGNYSGKGVGFAFSEGYGDKSAEGVFMGLYLATYKMDGIALDPIQGFGGQVDLYFLLKVSEAGESVPEIEYKYNGVRKKVNPNIPGYKEFFSHDINQQWAVVVHIDNDDATIIGLAKMNAYDFPITFYNDGNPFNERDLLMNQFFSAQERNKPFLDITKAPLNDIFLNAEKGSLRFIFSGNSLNVLKYVSSPKDVLDEALKAYASLWFSSDTYSLLKAGATGDGTHSTHLPPEFMSAAEKMEVGIRSFLKAGLKGSVSAMFDSYLTIDALPYIETILKNPESIVKLGAQEDGVCFLYTKYGIERCIVPYLPQLGDYKPVLAIPSPGLLSVSQ